LAGGPLRLEWVGMGVGVPFRVTFRGGSADTQRVSNLGENVQAWRKRSYLVRDTDADKRKSGQQLEL
jgi:hypothetical protein